MENIQKIRKIKRKQIDIINGTTTTTLTQTCSIKCHNYTEWTLTLSKIAGEITNILMEIIIKIGNIWAEIIINKETNFTIKT